MLGLHSPSPIQVLERLRVIAEPEQTLPPILVLISEYKLVSTKEVESMHKDNSLFFCMLLISLFFMARMCSDVKASGFDPLTQGSAVQIPPVAKLSFGIKLTFGLFETLQLNCYPSPWLSGKNAKCQCACLGFDSRTQQVQSGHYLYRASPGWVTLP